MMEAITTRRAARAERTSTATDLRSIATLVRTAIIAAECDYFRATHERGLLASELLLWYHLADHLQDFCASDPTPRDVAGYVTNVRTYLTYQNSILRAQHEDATLADLEARALEVPL